MGGRQPSVDQQRTHSPHLTHEPIATLAVRDTRRIPMSRARYLGLLANLRQDDMLYEARRRRFSTEPIRPTRHWSFGASLLRALRITKR